MRQRRRPAYGQDLFRTTARVNRGALDGFGTPSIVSPGADCPVPEVPPGLFGIPILYQDEVKRSGSVTRRWCACVFGSTSQLFSECVDPAKFTYPWTGMGKLERGWNWEFSDFLPGGSQYVPPEQQPPGGGSASGGGTAPAGGSNTALIGGGLLLAALLLK